jgi:hypothetical protein
LEEELTRPEFLGTDEAAASLLADSKAQNRAFEEIFREARDAHPFDREAEDLDISETIRILRNGPLPLQGISMYQRISGRELDDTGIREFIDACPPFNATLVAQSVAHYDRCVRAEKSPAAYKAGRLDLFSAAYLPYADSFITKDPGQYNALKIVASEAGLKTEVLTYAEFRQNWLLS